MGSHSAARTPPVAEGLLAARPQPRGPRGSQNGGRTRLLAPPAAARLLP